MQVTNKLLKIIDFDVKTAKSAKHVLSLLAEVRFYSNFRIVWQFLFLSVTIIKINILTSNLYIKICYLCYLQDFVNSYFL